MSKVNKTNKELQADLDQLKQEFGDLMSVIQNSAKDKSNLVEETLKNGQATVQETMSQAYELGTENMKTVESKVKQNPLASVLIAFGTGYILSKVFTKD